MKMNKLAIVALGVAGIVSASAQAQMKPEDAIKLRQSAMKLIGYNFGSIGAMVNDKKPYDKDEAIRNASRVDALSTQPFEFFIAGTDKGETKAKADANAAEKVADARRNAAEEKLDADYKVALERCDALAGAAKDACVSNAKARYHK